MRVSSPDVCGSILVFENAFQGLLRFLWFVQGRYEWLSK
jgi:hypothetical protein